MRRHVVLCVVVLIAASAAVVDGQFKLRHRMTGRPPSVGNAAPVISIQTPTQSHTFTSAIAEIPFGGWATDDGAVTLVTWVNDRGGSGTASGTDTWTIPVGSGGGLKAQDTFSSAVNDLLAAHVPTPLGTAWTEAVDSAGTNSVQIFASQDYVHPTTTDNGGTGVLIYTITPASALSGADYTASVKIVATGNTDDPNGIVFGYTDSDDYCAAIWYGANASPDLYLFKVVAGVASTLGTPLNENVGANDVMSVTVDGTSLSVHRNGGAAIISATDGACDNTTTAGLGWGALRTSGDDVVTSASVDDFALTDNATGVAGVVLQTGTNVITVTASDGTLTSNDVITVTYDPSDMTDPTVQITAPTQNPTIGVAAAAMTVSGNVNDNVGVPADWDVDWACASCTTTSGAATLGSGTFTFNVTLGCSASPGTVNTITVTALDAAANDAIDTLVATCTSGDVTNPTVTITSDGGSGAGANYTASSSPIVVSGTAMDNVGVFGVSWANSLGGSGQCSGTVTWTCSGIGIVTGSNVITILAIDATSNPGTDTVTVAFTQTLTITTTSPLAPTVEDIAMSPRQLLSTGGVGSKTWSEVGGSLGTGACTGVSLSSAGVISGTPTTTGTCSASYRVTDSVAATDTDVIAFAVTATGAAGPYDYFDVWSTSMYKIKAFSLKPVAGQTSTSPYFQHQLTPVNQGLGGYMRCGSCGSAFSYNFAADTDPNKQDATKAVIPAFFGFTTLSAQMNTGPAFSMMTVPTSASSSALANTSTLKVDSEYVRIDRSGADPCGTGTTAIVNGAFCVIRAQFGTAQAVHTVSTVVYKATNSFAAFLDLPSGTTTDGNTYVFIWDAFYTSSYLLSGLTNHKAYQLTIGTNDRDFLEVITRFDGGNGPPGFSQATSVAVPQLRTYEGLGGNANWSLSSGWQMGPSVTTMNPVAPRNLTNANMPVIKPNVWGRFVVRVKQQANDYDLVDFWYIDENTDAKQVYSQTPFSVRPDTGNTIWGMWMPELDTSEDVCTRCASPNPERDLVSYHRGVLYLLNPPADLAAAGILDRPVR